ncbi:hypothetical protein TeGR_g14851, partial [Tetraparma gracilis]
PPPPPSDLKSQLSAQSDFGRASSSGSGKAPLPGWDSDPSEPGAWTAHALQQQWPMGGEGEWPPTPGKAGRADSAGWYCDSEFGEPELGGFR